MQAQTIQTVAGTGLVRFSGDGFPAVEAEIYGPKGMIFDKKGNLYIADCTSSHIRKIDKMGIITSVAGANVAGFSGDNGPANKAQLNQPTDIALDTAGNLYIADSYNNRIRKVDKNGIITTIAGNGKLMYGGDGGKADTSSLASPQALTFDKAGNLYISDCGNNRIRKISATGIISTVAGNGTSHALGDGGPATSAFVTGPQGIVFDSVGNLYIADNERVRKVNTAGIISTYAGNGSAGFGGDGGPATSARVGPYALTMDRKGNLYITDRGNQRLRMVNTSGIISTLAGTGTQSFSGDGGPAVSATFNFPEGVALDSAGNIFITDDGNGRVRKINTSGIISTIGGTGYEFYGGDGWPATSAQIYLPMGVAPDMSGAFYIADKGNNRVRKVSSSGIITTYAGTGIAGFSGDGGPAISAQLSSPTTVAIDSYGNVYIADQGNARVRKVDPAGTITTFAGTGISGSTGDGGPAYLAKLSCPDYIAVDNQGHVFIGDGCNRRIRVVLKNDTIWNYAGTGLWGTTGDGGLAIQAEIGGTSMAVDQSGNLYIAEINEGRIRKVNSAGIISTFAGNGKSGSTGDGGSADSASFQPSSVAVDRSGNLYFASVYQNNVRMVNASHIISTFAGISAQGFSGDGGPATAAEMNSPNYVATDFNGDVFITDYGNARIRKVSALVTGIQEIKKEQRVLIYPVPGNGLFTIRMSGSGYTSLKVFDLVGKEIYAQSLSREQDYSELKLDLSSLSNGMYLVRILSSDKPVSVRIEIQK
jgi:sugar lactone lactonase YvrE